MIDFEKVKARLRIEEGLRLHSYNDTLGFPTIGYGHLNRENFEEVSLEQAEEILDRDVKNAWWRLTTTLQWVIDQPSLVQEMLTDMTFQLGVSGLKGFKHALAALQSKDYKTAKTQFLDSLWASQTPNRAKSVTSLLNSLIDVEE